MTEKQLIQLVPNKWVSEEVLMLITGLMLGFEYVGEMDEDDGFDHHLIFDILFVRVLIFW